MRRAARATPRGSTSRSSPAWMSRREAASNSGAEAAHRLKKATASDERPYLPLKAALIWYLALSGLLGDHQGDAGGEAVQEVLRTHGADLAVAEEACRGDRPQEVRQRPSVVIRRPEQADAATVAGTQQRPNGLARAELRPHSLE